jgi:hypothetical protein
MDSSPVNKQQQPANKMLSTDDDEINTVFIDEEFIDQYVINNKQLADNEIRPDTHIKLKYAQSLATYKSNSEIINAFNNCDLGYFGISEQTVNPQQLIIKYLDRVRQRYKFT